MNVFEEQQKNDIIRTVTNWIKRNVKAVTTYSNTELQKENKQLNRLELYNNVLYRKFFNNTEQNFIRQSVPSEHFCHEILLRIHNSKFMGHLEIVETANQIRPRFYFPEFKETLLDYVSNSSSCLQVKSIQQKSLKTTLLPIASKQGFPGDLMEVDVVGKHNPCGGYTHINSAMDIFNRYLFLISEKNASAENVAADYLSETILTRLQTFNENWKPEFNLKILLSISDQNSR